MFYVWIIVATVLALIVAVIGILAISDDVVNMGDKVERHSFFAIWTLGFLVAVIWPLVIPLVILGMLLYGLYSIFCVLREKPWKDI